MDVVLWEGPSRHGVDRDAFARWAEEVSSRLLSAVSVILHTARSLDITVDGATFRLPVGAFPGSGGPPMEATKVPGDNRVYIRAADGRPEVWAIVTP